MDNIIKKRIKIGVTVILVLLVIGSTSLGSVTITDTKMTFSNTIQIFDDSVSIQSAIDSITDASKTNQYEIILYPGIYNENIVLKDWVFLSGVTDSHDIILSSNTGKLIVWDDTGCSDGNSSGVTNLQLTSTPTTPDVEIINSTCGNHVISDCDINVYPTATSMTVVSIRGYSNVTIKGCNFYFEQTGDATDHKHRCIIVRENGSLRSLSCDIDMLIEDHDDIAVAIGISSSAVTEFHLSDSQIHMTSTNTTCFNGTWQALSVGSNTTDTNVQGNHIHLKCISNTTYSTGNAYCYKSHTGTGAEIHSTCNRIIVEGFPFSYFAYVNAPNHVVSHFDDVVSFEKVTGTGNVTAVYSREDGELYTEYINLFKEMHVDRDLSGLTTGCTATIFDVVLNLCGATGGHIHVLDVALSGNDTGVNVSAIGVQTGVGVVCQHIGEEAYLCQAWLQDGGTYWDVTNEFNSSDTDVTMFGNDSEYVYVGSNGLFDNIIVKIDTAASASIFQAAPTWEYSTGAGGWSSFTPGDDTNGFQQCGFIRFCRSSLSGWATNNVNGKVYYYIRVQRTRNHLAISPIEDTIQLESTVGGEYYWNEHGNVSINNIKTKVYSGSLTDGAPTDGEIDGILGTTPAVVGDGWSTYILDSDGTQHVYHITAVGTTWYYSEHTNAP